MKYVFILYLVILFWTPVSAQKLYTMSGGEIIFSSSIVEQNYSDVNSNLRFTLFFHVGEFVHLDLGSNVGFFSGIGLRNVGFITEEDDLKIKYRSYNLGVPFAFKAGSFRKNLYVFGGAEYEWMFHFKQKVFVNDEKSKYTSWFSNRTDDFIPSVFGGVQFPKGFQIKFKYYLRDFLNHDYDGGGLYTNYTTFNKTQVWYISLSYLIKNNRIKETHTKPAEMATL
jgi:hypothetical protein